MRRTLLTASIGTLILTGCANRGPVMYPAYKTAPTVAASTTTLSTMTETAASDYLIENSQVIVRGSEEGVKAPGFGALLPMAGIALERQRNGSAILEVEPKLSIKFDKALDEALKRTVSQAPFTGKVQLQAPDTASDLLLLPYAVLEVNAEKKIRLNFEIASRFTSAENNCQRKTYAYFGTAVDTPQSWTDNDNVRIRQASRVAFDRLTAVLLNDLSGKYKERVTAEKPPTTAYQPYPNGPIVTGLLLEQAAGYQVVMPMRLDQPLTRYVVLIDNSLVKAGDPR